MVLVGHRLGQRLKLGECGRDNLLHALGLTGAAHAAGVGGDQVVGNGGVHDGAQERVGVRAGCRSGDLGEAGVPRPDLGRADARHRDRSELRVHVVAEELRVVVARPVLQVTVGQPCVGELANGDRSGLGLCWGKPVAAQDLRTSQRQPVLGVALGVERERPTVGHARLVPAPVGCAVAGLEAARWQLANCAELALAACRRHAPGPCLVSVPNSCPTEGASVSSSGHACPATLDAVRPGR